MSNSEFKTSQRVGFWQKMLATSDERRRRRMIAAVCALVAVIGAADFATGIQISLLVFYFLPVCLAVAAVGWRFGVATAVASVATWLAGDFAAGARFANPIIPCWNALIALGTYLLVIWLLQSLLALHREMEERVRQRTIALTDEIAERGRLERAVLEIGERERRDIGRDLHDGLGQHLTGTALVAQALAARLYAQGSPDADEARKVVGLVEQGIEQTRQVAKGLVLGEVERDSLAAALEGLASEAQSKFRLGCEFRCHGEVPLEGVVATHLFRIAQEAVSNAARHGHARRIVVSLLEGEEEVSLEVKDNGSGLPPADGRGGGLGLKIMAHRAAMIGARFSIAAPPEGGTLVSCRLPLRSPS